jgi:hypothetical protein
MLALLTAVVTAAQPAPRPIDPAALAAATQLVQQLDIRGQVGRTMAQNVAMMRSGVALRSMLAQQPGFIPAYQANKAKFDPALKKAGAIQAEVAEKIIRENTGAVVTEAARAYARNYTAAELKGLSDFYRSPLGQALAQRQAKVSAEIGQATARIIGAKIDAGMQAAAPRLQAALAPLNSAPPKK